MAEVSKSRSTNKYLESKNLNNKTKDYGLMHCQTEIRFWDSLYDPLA